MDESTPFVQGWYKLPDELKLEVVRHAVPPHEVYNGIHFSWNLSKRIEFEECMQKVSNVKHCDKSFA